MINKDSKKMMDEVGVAKIEFEKALDAEVKAFTRMQNAEVKYNKLKIMTRKKERILQELMEEKDGS